jgi:prepilin-type N-terminal cleavage/methylation domain-containing protein
MTTTLRRGAGFTIIEISLVLIVLGILAAAFLPMIQTTHDDVLRKQDMASMEAVRDALMGYIRINEGIPCVDAGGTQVTTGCDPTETLDLLGLRTTDSRRMPFAYDVNDTLTVAEIAASGNSLCTALANIINPAVPPATPPDPTICDSDNANTGDVACTATHPMALVLVGRGSDRCLNLENTHANAPNDGVCETAVLENRTFENPVRLSSRTQDDGYYEDLVYTITPNELAEAMECPAGGGGGTNFAICGAGETLVQVSNGDNSAMSIGTGGSCYVISEGTTASMGCQLESTSITVYANQSCTSNLFTNTLSGLDTNNDGRADVVCDNANVCTWR